MDYRVKPTQRLQLLLLKTLKPNQLSRSESMISDAAGSITCDSPFSPEYTTVYQDFFLEGIVTVAIQHNKPGIIFWKLECIDSTYEGETLVQDWRKATQSQEQGEALVELTLKQIISCYIQQATKDCHGSIRH